MPKGAAEDGLRALGSLDAAGCMCYNLPRSVDFSGVVVAGSNWAKLGVDCRHSRVRHRNTLEESIVVVVERKESFRWNVGTLGRRRILAIQRTSVVAVAETAVDRLWVSCWNHSRL